MRHLQHKDPLDPSFAPFTKAATNEAIRRSSNSMAVGSYGLTALHLKHFGHQGLTYLNKLFNLVIGNADLPVV
jgi:hypothetical protein